MRQQGLQPTRVEGAYDLARRATSPAEVRLNTVISDKDAAIKRKGTRLMENMLEISDTGMTSAMPDLSGKKLSMKKKRT